MYNLFIPSSASLEVGLSSKLALFSTGRVPPCLAASGRSLRRSLGRSPTGIENFRTYGSLSKGVMVTRVSEADGVSGSKTRVSILIWRS